MICCRIIKETPSLNMNGHQKSFGKGCSPVSFLTHQMNHSRKGNRLVINFGKRKSSILFPEFGYFLKKKKLKKTPFRLKKYRFSSAFQEFTPTPTPTLSLVSGSHNFETLTRTFFSAAVRLRPFRTKLLFRTCGF